jgi:hypothetical protein
MTRTITTFKNKDRSPSVARSQGSISISELVFDSIFEESEPRARSIASPRPSLERPQNEISGLDLTENPSPSSLVFTYNSYGSQLPKMQRSPQFERTPVSVSDDFTRCRQIRTQDHAISHPSFFEDLPRCSAIPSPFACCPIGGDGQDANMNPLSSRTPHPNLPPSSRDTPLPVYDPLSLLDGSEAIFTRAEGSGHRNLMTEFVPQFQIAPQPQEIFLPRLCFSTPTNTATPKICRYCNNCDHQNTKFYHLLRRKIDRRWIPSQIVRTTEN